MVVRYIFYHKTSIMSDIFAVMHAVKVWIAIPDKHKHSKVCYYGWYKVKQFETAINAHQ
jgi:hypothetical protein